MSDMLLVDYMPEPNETYKMARSLGYEIALKSGAFIDAITISAFSVVGFLVSIAFLGLELEKSRLQHVYPVFLILLPATVIGFLLWHLFRVWCLAPSMDDPKPEQFRISHSDNSLILETGPSRVVVSLERLNFYIERNEYFAFQTDKYSVGIIIPKRAFCENAIDRFRQILTENGVRAGWLTYRRLLG
jgi:hypothetical protein